MASTTGQGHDTASKWKQRVAQLETENLVLAGVMSGAAAMLQASLLSYNLAPVDSQTDNSKLQAENVALAGAITGATAVLQASLAKHPESRIRQKQPASIACMQTSAGWVGVDAYYADMHGRCCDSVRQTQRGRHAWQMLRLQSGNCCRSEEPCAYAVVGWYGATICGMYNSLLLII